MIDEAVVIPTLPRSGVLMARIGKLVHTFDIWKRNRKGEYAGARVVPRPARQASPDAVQVQANLPGTEPVVETPAPPPIESPVEPVAEPMPVATSPAPPQDIQVSGETRNVELYQD